MNDIKKGDEVVVISGRKIPIGTIGICFWIGKKPWGVGIGIEFKDGRKDFTAAKNVILCVKKNEILVQDENKPKTSGWGF